MNYISHVVGKMMSWYLESLFGDAINAWFRGQVMMMGGQSLVTLSLVSGGVGSTVKGAGMSFIR